jgi:hypothetical protein
MPKLKRSDLPQAVFNHLLVGVQKGRISVDGVQQFQVWMDSNPTVGPGNWFKRFGDFTVCGRGPLVLTFLESHHTAVGEEVE